MAGASHTHTTGSRSRLRSSTICILSVQSGASSISLQAFSTSLIFASYVCVGRAGDQRNRDEKEKRSGAEHCRAEQSRAEQSRAEQGRAGQGRADQSRAQRIRIEQRAE